MRPRSRPFEEARGEVLGALKSGLSLPAAARLAGVAPRTVEHWLTRGRREPGSPYVAFAEAVESAREAREGVPTGEMSERELREVVARQARAGNVQAMRLMFELLGADARPAAEPAAVDPLRSLDELAAARASRQGRPA